MISYFVYLLASVLVVYFGYLFYKSYHYQPLSSKNKAVFITGCDSGFGFLTAQRLAERGYRIFAGCLFPEGEGANELRSFSSKIEIVPLDVTNGQNVKEAVKTVEANLGNDELWAIINNAGIGHAGEIEWCPIENIFQLFEVNVFGMVRVTQNFLPLLRKSKGRIVNLTSISGIRKVPSILPYSMSKSAASTFSDGIRLEMMKWNIKVINIQPYFYSTNLTGKRAVISYFDEAWKNADSTNTSVLGAEYFKRYANRCKDMVDVLNSKRVEDVIYCLEDAVISPYPKLHYRPGSIINKIMINLPHYLPICVQDILHYNFLYSNLK